MGRLSLSVIRFKQQMCIYSQNSNIHGLKYIVERKSNYREKIFWIVSCALACWGMIRVAAESWHQFHFNPVSFVQDTAYLNWSSSFPAVSVCETDADLGAIAVLADRIYGVNHNLDLETFLRDIVYYDGKCYSCQNLCGKTINCTRDFESLIQKARLPCEKLFMDCKWNDRPFNCCQVFAPLNTEHGLCFAINSLQANSTNTYIGNFKSNKTTGPGKINFSVQKDVQIYIHSHEDVPFINHPMQEKELVILGTVLELSFQLNEIDNDPALHGLPIQMRSCRFPQENNLKTSAYYGYSACVVECRTYAQIELCNCTHHFMPKLRGVETCNLTGLLCLSENSKILGSVKAPGSSKQGLVCNCPSSCNEMDFTIVSALAQGYKYFNSKPFFQLYALKSAYNTSCRLTHVLTVPDKRFNKQ